ncbi:3-oxoacyl-[acyl-carrier-protein] reductase FabG [Bdellovibrio bacteriovorus]|uniref:3-oxoacyl-[acyl-carrier-protein] reductase n=1 Tax=Bdellovibrio bacteriovorus TaxID=959 RepID=UPI00045BF75A|nr:3-oxoacyl-[acyl-carrier-protein] reductase [Bdellovibrio bacteriovorus]AHZ84506.1 3-ketoacyl-ACP reductase [Bdellovibrio bacteriovorus]BEV68395.1 3-oxoacyl-[acyl-carrier-protein] reductase FabG [Bdellovibrio bacteriovorus]
MSGKSLQGKKIVVTGGSRGIGAAIVKLLADEGAQVAFTYSSREEAAQQVAHSLTGEGHFYIKMDIANEESVNSAVDHILEKWSDIDGVVNNAGITKDGLLLRMKSEDFDTVVNTNLRGTFLVTKAFTKPMMKARKGSIVNIVSIIGETGNAGQANYAASKAGTIAFSKSVALELGSRNVRVNNVAPGYIATEMTDVLSEDVKSKMMEKIPLAKIGEGSDVAQAVRFLLSDESKYITGHTLDVNGGMHMN